jgi:hypothetical protein
LEVKFDGFAIGFFALSIDYSSRVGD